MFSQYFGHFLLNHELITRDQLADALEFQQSVHVKIGVMAINEGDMTPAQVEEVHEKQKQEDKRFGEIAVELGYLTNEQVESLISDQKPSYLYLAQALVDRKYMTFEQFASALNDYKKANSLSDDQFASIKSGSIESLVETILSSKDGQTNRTFGKYLSLFAKNMIRFIDDQVYVEVEKLKTAQPGKWLVYQEISGESPLFTAISANEEIFLQIASSYAEEELTEADEMAKASVSEFLNLNNGIYLVNMSNWGVELSMKPPVVMENAAVSGELFHVSVHTTKGSFQIILTDQPGKISIGQK